MSILQKLYDSEINCGLQSDWDGGWSVWLGDDLNGHIAEGTAADFAGCEAWLEDAALKHYPRSRFADHRAP